MKNVTAMNSCNEKLYYGCLWTYFEKRTDSAQEKVSGHQTYLVLVLNG